ncbi:fish-egg lectin isoform X3 [Salvelinus sp. IW2-2015]|uniref:fish-egg lectin isoform X3 n=1 Tax=Salvelinus sp. IW2-2015 TaxID=2691554 RepID=UPI0038D4E180
MRATAAVLLVLCLLTISHAWDCQEVVKIKNLMQIDAGLGQVVATDTSQIPYYLVGDEWIRLPGSLKHITVGPAGIWSINSETKISKYVAGNWVHFRTGTKQVDAGGDQFILGATKDDIPFCLKRSFTLDYMGRSLSYSGSRLPGSGKYYSCGPFGCWAVNKNDDIYIMSNVNRDTCLSNGWRHIDGKLSMIEVATDGSVFGVNSAGQVYSRDGITASKPEGTGWSNIPMSMRMGHGTTWAVFGSSPSLASPWCAHISLSFAAEGHSGSDKFTC